MPLYECDPDGDIILHLQGPARPFAVWDDTSSYLRPTNHESVPTDDELDDGPTPLSIESASADELMSFENAREPADISASSDDSTTKEDEYAEPPGVEMRVSSRHLILASSYFKRMLNGDWEESKALRLKGCLRIEEKDWDAGALQIVMDIIHGRTRNVPKVISLETLAKVAVLVDYYECLEVVEIFSSMWMESLKYTITEKYSRDVMLWICISWTFGQSDMFRLATEIAIMYSTGPVQMLSLPIPERIIRKLFERPVGKR
jgi:BTB/POZ domain